MSSLYPTAYEITDFNDFNYESIAFRIGAVNKDRLKERLKADYINHLYELDNAEYIAIWNCDLQGFKSRDDIYFYTDPDEYRLASLISAGGKWFYIILDEHAKVDSQLRFM